MFGLSDVLRIILSIFVVMPIVSIIHELGHLVFVYLFKAKKTTMSIGCGDTLFRFGIIEVKRFYFWYSCCSYEKLKYDRWISHFLIYAGPIIFTLAGAGIVNWLTLEGVLAPSYFTYLFIYFSLYFVAFDIIPMRYPSGQPSNGKVLLDLIQYGKEKAFEQGKC